MPSYARSSPLFDPDDIIQLLRMLICLHSSRNKLLILRVGPRAEYTFERHQNQIAIYYAMQPIIMWTLVPIVSTRESVVCALAFQLLRARICKSVPTRVVRGKRLASENTSDEAKISFLTYKSS